MSSSGEYVFQKNGDGIKFVGRFDDLYHNVPDPWGQMSDKGYYTRRFMLIDALRSLSPSTILDVGCGFGHATQAIKLLITDNVTGIDISKEAVSKARKLFSDVQFIVHDIQKGVPFGKYDIIILNNVLWYIIPNLISVVCDIYNHLNRNGHLIISQAFIEDQKYATDIINGYDGLIGYFKDNFSDVFDMRQATISNIKQRKKDSITVFKKKGNSFG